jgi:hypothetical protein
MTDTTMTRANLTSYVRQIATTLDTVEAHTISRRMLGADDARWVLGHFRYALQVLADIDRQRHPSAAPAPTIHNPMRRDLY